MRAMNSGGAAGEKRAEPRRAGGQRLGDRAARDPRRVSAMWTPGLSRSQSAVAIWWSVVCSPHSCSRGSITIGRPYWLAVITEPMPAWATTSRASATVRANAAGRAGAPKACAAARRRPVPIWARSSLGGVRLGPGVHHADQPVEREHRADGDEDQQHGAPVLRARPGRARCSHWVSQTSATRRACAPEDDRRSALAMLSIQIVLARSRVLASAERDQARGRAGGDHHVGPLAEQDAGELERQHREARPVAPADVAHRVVAPARHVRGRGGVDAGVGDVEPLEGGHQPAQLHPMSAARGDRQKLAGLGCAHGARKPVHDLQLKTPNRALRRTPTV